MPYLSVLFRRLLAALALSGAAVVGPTAATAQGGSLDALARQLGCTRAPGYRSDGLSSGTANSEFLRCCLALLDRNHLQNANSRSRDAAAQLEAGILARLAAAGQSDQPRACTAPASWPPPVSWPILGPGPGPNPGPGGGRGRVAEAPGAGRGPVGSWPGLTVSLGFGALLGQAGTVHPTGPGTAQEFHSNPWSRPLFDARVSIPLYALALSAAPRSRGTAPILSFGFTHIGSTVNSLTNRGGVFSGVSATGFQGSTSINRLYIASALAIPLILGARSAGSMPGTDLMLGASLGYSMLTTSVPAAGFSRSQSGLDYGLSAGLRLHASRSVTIEPGVEYIFSPAGGAANDSRLLGMLRVSFAF